MVTTFLLNLTSQETSTKFKPKATHKCIKRNMRTIQKIYNTDLANKFFVTRTNRKKSLNFNKFTTELHTNAKQTHNNNIMITQIKIQHIWSFDYYPTPDTPTLGRKRSDQTFHSFLIYYINYICVNKMIIIMIPIYWWGIGYELCIFHKKLCFYFKYQGSYLNFLIENHVVLSMTNASSYSCIW